MVEPGKNWYRNYFCTTVFRKESSTTYQKSKSPSRCEIPFFSCFLCLFFRYFQNPRMRNREKKSSLLMVSLLRNDCFCALLLDRNITFNHLILFYVLFLFLYEEKKKKIKRHTITGYFSKRSTNFSVQNEGCNIHRQLTYSQFSFLDG